jgi:hypothetical protein
VLAEEMLGEPASVRLDSPLMGAEDFSYVLERVPGAMTFLGACPPGWEPATAAPNHSNLVVFDEEPLPAGVAMYARMALDALSGGSTLSGGRGGGGGGRAPGGRPPPHRRYPHPEWKLHLPG